MNEREGIERWLPTVERARALGPIVVERGWFRSDLNLWDAKLTQVDPLAGILMRGRILRRDAWETDEELSVARWQQLVARAAPDPRSFVEARYLRVLHSDGDGPCSHCAPGAPGQTACVACNGAGVVVDNADVPLTLACRFCNGGLVLCAHCDGAGRAVKARVEYIDQRVEGWSSLVLPDVATKLSWWLHERLQPSIELPEELRFPLDRMLDSGPYRGTSVQREPEFRGYRFQGAFERAREALREITGRGDVLASEYQSYAAPILCARFEADGRAFDAVFIAEGDGALTGYAAAAG